MSSQTQPQNVHVACLTIFRLIAKFLALGPLEIADALDCRVLLHRRLLSPGPGGTTNVQPSSRPSRLPLMRRGRYRPVLDHLPGRGFLDLGSLSERSASGSAALVRMSGFLPFESSLL